MENYVKFLTEHLRSLIRNMVKKHGIEEFHAEAIDILRDAVLGASGEEGAKRKGRAFEENGMRIYDLEVLGVRIGDSRIASLLVDAQHDTVQTTLGIQTKQRELELTRRQAVIERELAEISTETAKEKSELEQEGIKATLAANLVRIAASAEADQAKLKNEASQQDILDELGKRKLARERSEADQELSIEGERQKLELDGLNAQTTSFEKRFAAIQPDLVAAINAYGTQDFAQKMAVALAPLAIMEQQGVSHLIERFFKGTPLASAFEKALQPSAKS